MSKHDPMAQLLLEVLESYKDEYRELSEIWRNLDTKAQGIIGIDGLFLAALFAFIRVLTAEPTLSEKRMLTISAALLFISVGFAIRALWIQSVPKAPIGESLDSLVSDLLALPDGMEPERLNNLSNDHAGLWKETNKAVQGVNERKAKAIVLAQGAFLAALIESVFFTIYKIWS